MEHIYRRDRLEWVIRLYKRLPFFRQKTATISQVDATAEVSKESDYTDSVVQSNQVENYAIVVSKLTKRFEAFEAVRDISFTVKRGMRHYDFYVLFLLKNEMQANASVCWA